MTSSASTCPCCGSLLDDRDRDHRFGWPDAVFALPDRECTEGSWLDATDPRRADLMQVPGAGSFVRVLLPVSLSDGFSLTFGIWLRVTEDDLHRAFTLWRAPEYADLSLTGQIANAVAPWDVLGVAVHATVVDPELLPYCTASEDSAVSELLAREWPHAALLAAYTC